MWWHDAADVILHEPAHGQQGVLQDLEFIVEVAVHDGLQMPEPSGDYRKVGSPRQRWDDR
jgi:hypothetical protein